MSESMIERVARSLCEAQRQLPGDPTWETTCARDLYRVEARAAIEAMREPTTAMIWNGGRAGRGDPWFNGMDVRPEVGASSVWALMIDAALEKDKTGEIL